MVTNHLQRDPLPLRSQPGAAVGRVIDQALGGGSQGRPKAAARRPTEKKAALRKAATKKPAAKKAKTSAKKAKASAKKATKTARFLDLVTERHGSLAQLPLNRVAGISAELAPQLDLNPGAARTALRKAVLAAKNGASR